MDYWGGQRVCWPPPVKLFGFDIRIGLWQVNELRPFYLAFNCDSTL